MSAFNNAGSEKTDIYTRVTQKIIDDLEKGELTWRKPWSSEHLAGNVVRPLRFNGIPYSGINTFILWAVAAEQGYNSPFWMTYAQAHEFKANVRKGEKSTQVVYADKIIKEEVKENGEIHKEQIPFLKVYTVFNANQIDGLPEHFYQVPERKILNMDNKIQEVEQFFENTNAKIVLGTKAAYSSTYDRIVMPPFESFVDATRYYGTLAHEVTHWTKHPTRLNRDFNRIKFGDEGYAQEELVAELGACFLVADLGLEPSPIEEHAAYIKSWLQVLKNDKRFIFQAATHAQKAVEYINSTVLSFKLLV